MTTPQLPYRDLASAYGVSAARVHQLRQAGADVTDPNALLDYLWQTGQRWSGLLERLVDDDERHVIEQRLAELKAARERGVRSPRRPTLGTAKKLAADPFKTAFAERRF